MLPKPQRAKVRCVGGTAGTGTSASCNASSIFSLPTNSGFSWWDVVTKQGNFRLVAGSAGGKVVSRAVDIGDLISAITLQRVFPVMMLIEHIPGESARLAVLELMLLMADQSSAMGGCRDSAVPSGTAVGRQISLTTYVRCSIRTAKNGSDRSGNIDSFL